MMVFNFITLNDDAHLKNFSLINRGGGEYTLAPAYDLINTSLHLSVPRIFALDKSLISLHRSNRLPRNSYTDPSSQKTSNAATTSPTATAERCCKTKHHLPHLRA